MFWSDALLDEIRYPAADGERLSRTGARYDKEKAFNCGNRFFLRRIQTLQDVWHAPAYILPCKISRLPLVSVIDSYESHASYSFIFSDIDRTEYLSGFILPIFIPFYINNREAKYLGVPSISRDENERKYSVLS
jgi:hypothetical protein